MLNQSALCLGSRILAIGLGGLLVACGDAPAGEGGGASGDDLSFPGLPSDLACQSVGATPFSGTATISYDGREYRFPMPRRLVSDEKIEVLTVCQSSSDPSAVLTVNFLVQVIDDFRSDYGLDAAPMTFTAETPSGDDVRAERGDLAVLSFGASITAVAPFEEDLDDEDRYQNWAAQYTEPSYFPDEALNEAATWTEDFEIEIDTFVQLESEPGSGRSYETHGTLAAIELAPVRYVNEDGEQCVHTKDCELEAGRKPATLSIEF